MGVLGKNSLPCFFTCLLVGLFIQKFVGHPHIFGCGLLFKSSKIAKSLYIHSGKFFCFTKDPSDYTQNSTGKHPLLNVLNFNQICKIFFVISGNMVTGSRDLDVDIFGT
jgi:hypothetical protein